jgi:hypothetical protein
MRTGFGVIGVVGVLLVALIAGGIGYWIGVTAEAVPVAGGTVGYGWGFPFFGLLFGILFIVLIVSIARRTWVGPGWYGPGRWSGFGPEHRSVPPAFEPMLEDWHRKAHGNAEQGNRGSVQA